MRKHMLRGCISIGVVMCFALGWFIYRTPSLTPREIVWEWRDVVGEDAGGVALTGIPFGAEEKAEVFVWLTEQERPIGRHFSTKQMTGWGFAAGDGYEAADGSPRLHYFTRYYGFGILRCGVNDYRFKMLRGGNALQVGDNIVEIAPGDRVEVVLSSPDEYSITVNDEAVPLAKN